MGSCGEPNRSAGHADGRETTNFQATTWFCPHSPIVQGARRPPQPDMASTPATHKSPDDGGQDCLKRRDARITHFRVRTRSGDDQLSCRPPGTKGSMATPRKKVDTRAVKR